MLLNCLFDPELFSFRDYVTEDVFFTEYFGLPASEVEEFGFLCHKASVKLVDFFPKFVSAQEKEKRKPVFKASVFSRVEFKFSDYAFAVFFKENYKQGNLENYFFDHFCKKINFDPEHCSKLAAALCSQCTKSIFPWSLVSFIKDQLNFDKILYDCKELVELDELNLKKVEENDAKELTFIGKNELKYESNNFQDKVFEEIMKKTVLYTSNEFIEKFDWAEKNNCKFYIKYVLSWQTVSHELYTRIQRYSPENHFNLPGEVLSEEFVDEFIDVCCINELDQEKFFTFLTNLPISMGAYLREGRNFYYHLFSENEDILVKNKKKY